MNEREDKNRPGQGRLGLSLPRRRTLDNIASLVGLPRGFHRLSPTEKLKAVLALDNTAGFIRRLRPDDFCYLLCSIGLEDCYMLLPYATEEQRRMLADMWAWKGPDFMPHRLERILAAAEGSSVGVATQYLESLDPEVVALYLFTRADFHIHDPEQDQKVMKEEGVFLSPDGVFLVTCKDPDHVPAVRHFLDLLYALGVERAHRIIFGGMYDLPSSLRAMAYRFRDARLQDFGFEGGEERGSLFAPFDARSFKEAIKRGLLRHIAGATGRKGSEDASLAMTLSQAEGASFLWQALDSLGARDLRWFIGNAAYLANRLFSALYDDLADDAAREDAARHCTATMSVGLEWVTDGDIRKARKVVRYVYPVHLYRCGFECLRPLNSEARQVVASLGGQRHLHMLGSPLGEVLAAAASFPSRLHEPAVHGIGADTRWFETLVEVERVHDEIQMAAVVVWFAKVGLGFDPTAVRMVEGSLCEPTFKNVLATALARIVLDGEPSLNPLDGKELRDFVRMVFRGGKIRDDMRRSMVMAVGRDLDETEQRHLAEFVEGALGDVEEALGGLSPSDVPDTRFVGGALLVR